MKKKINRISFYALLFCIVSILSVSLMKSKWNNEGSEAVLSWDVTGYYMYLPAAIIYKDFRKLEFKESMMKKYEPSSSFYQAFELDNGDWLLQYPVGLAVMYLPGFLVGHLGAAISSYPQDGFSAPYQIGIWLEGLLVAFLGLWILRSFLLHYFSDKAVAATLLILTLTTNYMNYAAIDGAMTHNYEFTLYAAVLYFTRKWYLFPNFKRSAILGLLIGLAALARPTNIVIAIVPLAFGLASLKSLKSTIGFLWKHWPKLALAAFVTLLIGSIQLIYWKMYSGDWIYYTYRDYGFSWKGQHLKDCFFSFRKGWFIYTPVMIFAVMGFWALFRGWQKLFWFSFLFFLVNTYIVFSWDIWWYGGSFGQRAMVDSYAILAIPLTAFNQAVFKSFWKYLIVPVLVFFTWLNLHQVYQLHAHKGGMDPEFMTEAYYWRIFGRTNIPDSDRILMDTDEDFLGERKKVKTIFKEDFESHMVNNENLKEGGKEGSKVAVFLNGDFQTSPVIKIKTPEIEGDWIRVNGDFYAPWKEWEMWVMSKFRVGFYKGDQKIKERFIRIQRLLGTEQWAPIWIDTEVPEKAFDNIRIYIDHSNGKTHLWMDNIVVESFEG